MAIFLNILFLIIGLALLIKGADFFVSGASAIAKKFKVPTMLIGLTIVALGTSLPELSVSVASAIKGSTDMSVGNIVGSNMMNMLLILGVVALIHPVPITKSSKKIDFPFLIVLTMLLLVFSADVILNGDAQNMISRTESIVFLAMLVFYITILVINANFSKKLPFAKEDELNFSGEMSSQTVNETLTKDEAKDENKLETNMISTLDNDESLQEENLQTSERQNQNLINQEEKSKKLRFKKEKNEDKILKSWQIALCLIFGLAAVVFGAECVSSTAQFLAIKIGMSEALVGLTIVAVGTSLPELATSIAASRRGDNQMALGNILGSNVINIALVLGLVGVISPVAITSTILIDMLILTIFTIIFSVICMTSKKEIKRWVGILLLIMYIAYITFAIVRNYVGF